MRFRQFVVFALLPLSAACSSHAGQAFQGSAAGALPQVIQTGQSPTQWAVFLQSFVPNGITVGADKQIWVSSQQAQSVSRFEITTGNLTSVSVGFGAGPIVEGPDGNVWTCDDTPFGNDGLAKVSPSMGVTKYPAPKCWSIAAGPDGAIWFTSVGNCAIERATTDGSVTEYVSPYCPNYPRDILAGSDGNIWFTESGTVFGVVRFTLATSTFTRFTTTKPLSGLALGSDGNLYSCQYGDMMQITPTGVMQIFELATPCIQTQPTTQRKAIYYTAGSGNGAKWTVVGHSDFAYGPSPSRGASQAVTFGPDMNVWSADAVSYPNGGSIEVYINRILSVTPSSAVISQGSSQAFTIAETHCSCIWSATSSNPNVVSVSAVTGNQFIATATGVGSAAIAVADQKQNVFNVAIVVQ